MAAAGNSGADIDESPVYPAAWAATTPGMLAVAATDYNDNPVFFTNYGSSSVQVAAPGVDVWSTYTVPTGQLQNWANYFYVGPYPPSPAPPNNYSIPWYFGGTNNHWSYPPPSSQGYYLFGDKLFSNCTGYTGNPQITCVQGTYPPNTDATATSGRISLAGMFAVAVNLYLPSVDIAAGDSLVVSLSSDNVTWTPVLQITGTGGASIPLDGSAYDNSQLYVRLELVSAPDSPGGAGVDGAGVFIQYTTPSGYDTDGLPVFAGENYQFDSGTSMAAPHAAGIAALALAETPGLTNTELSELISENVDKRTALAGLVSSSGRVNAYKTVMAASLGILAGLSGEYGSGQVSLSLEPARRKRGDRVRGREGSVRPGSLLRHRDDGQRKRLHGPHGRPVDYLLLQGAGHECGGGVASFLANIGHHAVGRPRIHHGESAEPDMDVDGPGGNDPAVHCPGRVFRVAPHAGRHQSGRVDARRTSPRSLSAAQALPR